MSKQISFPPNKHLLVLRQTNSCAFISPSQPRWRLQGNIRELENKREKISEEDRTLGFTAVLSLPLSQASALLRVFVTPGSPEKCSCYNGIFLGNFLGRDCGTIMVQRHMQWHMDWTVALDSLGEVLGSSDLPMPHFHSA